MSQITLRWRPELRDVEGDTGIVLWQRRQAICEVVMIRAVELVRRRIVRMVAPERPQYGTGDEQQRQGAAARKDFPGNSRDPWALRTQSQGLALSEGDCLGLVLWPAPLSVTVVSHHS